MPVSPESIAGAVATPPLPVMPDAAATPPAQGTEAQPELLACLDPDNPDRVYTQLPTDPIERGRIMVQKDRAFAEMKAQNEALFRLLNQPRQDQQATPAADPVVARAAELERDIRAQYPGESAENIQAEALRVARIEIRAEQKAEARVDRKMSDFENASVFRNNPFLGEPWAQDVLARYRPASAAQHLELCVALAPNYGVRLPNAQVPASPANPQQVVTDRFQQQREAARQPAGGGNGGGTSATGDTPGVLEAYATYCRIKPRATEADKAAALQRMRASVKGSA